MARDQEPVTDEQLEEASERIQDQREDVREDLAAELGGNPDDYRADEYQPEEGDESSGEVVPDGGE